MKSSTKVVPLTEKQDERAVWSAVGDDVKSFTAQWTAEAVRVEGCSCIARRLVLIPYAIVQAGLDEDMKDLLTVGPQFTVLRYEGLGDAMLDNDVARLEAAAEGVDLKERKLAAAKCFESEINGAAASALSAQKFRDTPNENPRAVSEQCRGFVSAIYVERLQEATRLLIQREFIRIYKPGLKLVALAGILSLALLLTIHRWFIDIQITWHIVPAAMGMVAICVWITLRFGSALSVCYQTKNRLAGLVATYSYSKVWYASYALLIFGFGFGAMKLSELIERLPPS